MNTYLAVDCSQIEVQQVDGEIVVRIRAKVRGDPLRLHPNKVELLNETMLGQKEQLYAQLYKSKVVLPPPPPPQPTEGENKQQEGRATGFTANIFGKDENERQHQQQPPRPGNMFSHKADDRSQRPSSQNESIFSRKPQQREQRSVSPSWSNNMFTSSRPPQNRDGDRGSSYMSRPSHQIGSSYNTGYYNGPNQRSPRQGSLSSSGSNLFMEAPQPNNQPPSLFSDPSVGSSSNNPSSTHRRQQNIPRHKNKERIC